MTHSRIGEIHYTNKGNNNLKIKGKSFEEYYEEVTKKKTNDKSISNNNRSR